MKTKQVAHLVRRAIMETPKEDGGRWWQHEIAAELGVTKDNLSKSLSGKAHIRIEHLAKISVLLNVSFAFSIGEAKVTIGPSGAMKHYSQDTQLD